MALGKSFLPFARRDRDAFELVVSDLDVRRRSRGLAVGGGALGGAIATGREEREPPVATGGRAGGGLAELEARSAFAGVDLKFVGIWLEGAQASCLSVFDERRVSIRGVKRQTESVRRCGTWWKGLTVAEFSSGLQVSGGSQHVKADERQSANFLGRSKSVFFFGSPWVVVWAQTKINVVAIIIQIDSPGAIYSCSNCVDSSGDCLYVLLGRVETWIISICDPLLKRVCKGVQYS